MSARFCWSRILNSPSSPSSSSEVLTGLENDSCLGEAAGNHHRFTAHAVQDTRRSNGVQPQRRGQAGFSRHLLPASRPARSTPDLKAPSRNLRLVRQHLERLPNQVTVADWCGFQALDQSLHITSLRSAATPLRYTRPWEILRCHIGAMAAASPTHRRNPCTTACYQGVEEVLYPLPLPARPPAWHTL